jgi:hypothetical protein
VETTVEAAVKSSWFSKINWTIAIGFLINILTFLGYTVPADLETTALAAINSIVAIIVVIQRTFFTKTITTASAKSM